MQDGIIKGTGNSRYLKGAGWPATYAEFKSMAEAGTLPFDLNGINADGWQQIGTALSKGNLLSDTTAAKLNGVEAPNAAFDLLSRFHAGMGNEYMWQRSDGVYVNSTVSNAYPPTPSDGYTYTPLGQIGNKVRMATGKYTGTGTYGSTNPNTLTFDFAPSILLFTSVITTGGVISPIQYGFLDYSLLTTEFYPTSAPYQNSASEYLYFKKSDDGKTITWYDSQSAFKQLNASGSRYYYIAWG